jgi:hypothetical protein
MAAFVPIGKQQNAVNFGASPLDFGLFLFSSTSTLRITGHPAEGA